MNRIQPHSAGLAFGAFLAVCHAAWAALVAVGAAQWLLDVVFRLHMITPPYQIDRFNFRMAALLVMTTAVIGYAFGSLIAVIWNYCRPHYEARKG